MADQDEISDKKDDGQPRQNAESETGPSVRAGRSDGGETSSSTRNGEDNVADSDEDDDGVTMVDVLNDKERIEEDARAVLGGSDDTNCTYFTNGYMKRQALYSCLTCSGSPKNPEFKMSGICLACSYHCHEGHDLVELYTKRNFRCDCGNSKMEIDCKLAADKAPFNDRNRYDQNFAGVYCTCSRPYPDEEDPIEDEMIQCVVCEDWFHGRHLLKGISELPSDANYSEMICFKCAEKYSQIVQPYRGLSVGGGEKEEENVDVVAGEDDAAKNGDVCKRPAAKVSNGEITLFMPEDWRQDLCRCTNCVKAYDDAGLSYLIDPEDTVHYYEAEAKAKAEGGSVLDKGMEALSSMDRVQQVEAIQSYNSMKTNLMDYLKKFADNKKVVREEDILEFFQQMKGKKRPRIDMQKNCK